MSGLDEQAEKAFVCKNCGDVPYWLLVGFKYDGHKLLGVILSDREVRRTGKKPLHGISHLQPPYDLSFFQRRYWWFQLQCIKCGKLHGGSFNVLHWIREKILQLNEEDYALFRVGVDWP